MKKEQQHRTVYIGCNLSFYLNNFNLTRLEELDICNPHVATLIEAGCITHNKIQQNISLLKSGK